MIQPSNVGPEQSLNNIGAAGQASASPGGETGASPSGGIGHAIAAGVGNVVRQLPTTLGHVIANINPGAWSQMSPATQQQAHRVPIHHSLGLALLGGAAEIAGGLLNHHQAPPASDSNPRTTQSQSGCHGFDGLANYSDNSAANQNNI